MLARASHLVVQKAAAQRVLGEKLGHAHAAQLVQVVGVVHHPAQAAGGTSSSKYMERMAWLTAGIHFS
jgi:hypothetical protein